MKLTPFLVALGIVAALLSPPTHAGEGHDHDHGDATSAPAGTALPRFAAVSETFELVGVLDGKQLTLYLDRAADNAPVTDAQIELEIAGQKLEVEAHEDAYEAVLAAELTPGLLPIAATVTAGKEVEGLVGELDLHEDAHGDEDTHLHSWQEYASWAAAAVAALGALTLAGRRVAAARQRRTGAAA